MTCVSDPSDGKIALFMPSLGGGGAERAMLDVATGLAHRGMSVDLVLVRAEGQYLELAPECVRIVDLRCHRIAASLVNLLRYVKRERPGVLLATIEAAELVALLAKVSFARSVRVVVRQATTFSAYYGHAGSKDRLVMRALKLLMPFADAVIANSRGSADDLERSIPGVSGRVRVVPNPVVMPDHAEKAAEPVDHPWFGDGEPPVILAVGSLAPLKDHATLLRAFALVSRSQPARLVVLGEGPERGRLSRLAEELGIAERVDMPGFRVNPFAYMSRARLLAHSSLFEGFPNVLVQAMACGTPVVSTDCEHGPREILEGGKWGCLVPVGDAEAMADAILDALRAPVEPGLLASRAGAYSAEASVERYMEVLGLC